MEHLVKLLNEMGYHVLIPSAPDLEPYVSITKNVSLVGWVSIKGETVVDALMKAVEQADRIARGYLPP